MPAELKRNIIVAKSGYCLFALIIPILIINSYFNIFDFSTPSRFRLSGGIIIIVIILFYFLKNFVPKLLKALSPGWFKKTVNIVLKSLPWIAIALVLLLSAQFVKDLKRCAELVAVSMVIANIFDAFDEDFTQEWAEIKLTKRQDKYRSKYNV